MPVNSVSPGQGASLVAGMRVVDPAGPDKLRKNLRAFGSRNFSPLNEHAQGLGSDGGAVPSRSCRFVALRHQILDDRGLVKRTERTPMRAPRCLVIG
jgi:hypothetical protein